MKSRPARWAAAVSDAQDAVARLVELTEEYADWRDGMPENLDGSPAAEKLDAIADLGIDDLAATLDEAECAELPRGFGRD